MSFSARHPLSLLPKTVTARLSAILGHSVIPGHIGILGHFGIPGYIVILG